MYALSSLAVLAKFIVMLMHGFGGPGTFKYGFAVYILVIMQEVLRLAGNLLVYMQNGVMGAIRGRVRGHEGY